MKSVLIFPDSVLIAKLNFSNKKGCLINWQHQFIKSLTKMTFSGSYDVSFIFFPNIFIVCLFFQNFILMV